MENLTVIHDHYDFVRTVIPGLEGVLLWCSWAKLHNSIDLYRPDLVVFDALDDFPEWRALEEAMLSRSDAVVCSSRSLLDRFQQRHRRVALVPNGCDYDLFGRPPEELPQVGLGKRRGPRAGFTGAWGPWVDTSAIERAADALPSWDFCIIGPLLGGRVVQRPNVRYLGQRPYELLPSYLHQCDVALIPFADTEVTRAANPVKLWEYLAVGLPVVSTPLPEVIPFKGLVHVVEPARFPSALEAALVDCNRRDARRELARANTWESRYRIVSGLISELGHHP